MALWGLDWLLKQTGVPLSDAQMIPDDCEAEVKCSQAGTAGTDTVS